MHFRYMVMQQMRLFSMLSTLIEPLFPVYDSAFCLSVTLASLSDFVFCLSDRPHYFSQQNCI